VKIAYEIKATALQVNLL